MARLGALMLKTCQVNENIKKNILIFYNIIKNIIICGYIYQK